MNTPTQPTTTKQAALDEYMASVTADTIAYYEDLGYTDIRVTETGERFSRRYRVTGTKPLPAPVNEEPAPKATKPKNKPVSCGRISSHASWYRGGWVTDTCHCGHAFRVPTHSKGKYQCNCCADRAEGFFDD